MEVESDSAMPGRIASVLFVVTLAGFAGGMAIHTKGTYQVPSDQPLSASERTHLLAKGKELFLSRYARCHSENADKPLRTGAPLSERGLSSDVIARAMKRRLAEGTDEKRRTITLYIGNLMKTKDVESKSTP